MPGRQSSRRVMCPALRARKHRAVSLQGSVGARQRCFPWNLLRSFPPLRFSPPATPWSTESRFLGKPSIRHDSDSMSELVGAVAGRPVTVSHRRGCAGSYQVARCLVGRGWSSLRASASPAAVRHGYRHWDQPGSPSDWLAPETSVCILGSPDPCSIPQTHTASMLNQPQPQKTLREYPVRQTARLNLVRNTLTVMIQT